jgi:hypothetical protein
VVAVGVVAVGVGVIPTVGGILMGMVCQSRSRSLNPNTLNLIREPVGGRIDGIVRYALKIDP